MSPIHKKSQRKSKPIRKELRLTVVFIIASIVYFTGIWLYQRTSSYLYTYQELKEFALLEESNLKEIVFKDIFEIAETCPESPSDVKLACANGVGNLMYTSLKEELLPNNSSLHFVKAQNESIDILNWSGDVKNMMVGDEFTQLKDYSYRADIVQDYATYKTRLPSENEYVKFVQAMTGTCKYFNLYDYHACQVVVGIDLKDGAKGYLVQMISYTDEEMYWGSFFVSFYLLVSTMIVEPSFMPQIILGALLMGILSFLPPAILTWLYWFKCIKKHHK